MPYAKISNDSIELYNGPKRRSQWYIDNGYEVKTDLEIAEFMENHKPPFDPTLYSFSRYKLKNQLKNIQVDENTNMWDSVKAMLTSTEDTWEDFVIANDLNLADASFKQFYDAIKQTNPEIDTILEQCIL